MENNITALLRTLGVTMNYTGYILMIYALEICSEDNDALLAVTKYLYPDVAKRAHCTTVSVERNLRTVVNVVWKTHPDILSEIAGIPLTEKPTVSQFLAVLTSHLLCGDSLFVDIKKDRQNESDDLIVHHGKIFLSLSKFTK